MQKLAIYAPMINTAPYVMFWMHADPLQGQVGGVWVLEIETFLGPVKRHQRYRDEGLQAQQHGVYLLAGEADHFDCHLLRGALSAAGVPDQQETAFLIPVQGGFAAASTTTWRRSTVTSTSSPTGYGGRGLRATLNSQPIDRNMAGKVPHDVATRLRLA